MVKNINGDIYSDLITSHRDEIYGSNGNVGVGAKKYIVIHGVAGTRLDVVFGMWYSNTNPNGRQASANYAVDDTQIVGCVGEQASAWHCGGTGRVTNQNSIGIEHVNSYIGDINDASTYLFSEATINNGARLTAEICKRLGLTPDANTIIPHRAVYATACPQSLDMNDYIRRVVAFYNGSQPSGDNSQPAPSQRPTPAPQNLSAIQQFQNAGNKYVVSASFNVSHVTNHNGIWQLLSSDLLGGTLDGANWDNNGIPLDCITFTNHDGSRHANQTWDGSQPRFVFNGEYNHGTIDAYDHTTNAVGIDFGGYGRIWFNADAWLKG